MAVRPETLNKICEKAKSKKDGVWSHGGVTYRVMSGRLFAYVDYATIYTVHGHFKVEMGTFDWPWEAKKALKDLKA